MNGFQIFDLFFEILDIRNPNRFRTIQKEERILTTRNTYRLIIILNKIDLVPKWVTKIWISYFSTIFPTLGLCALNKLKYGVAYFYKILYAMTNSNKKKMIKILLFGKSKVGKKSFVELLLYKRSNNAINRLSSKKSKSSNHSIIYKLKNNLILQTVRFGRPLRMLGEKYLCNNLYILLAFAAVSQNINIIMKRRIKLLNIKYLHYSEVVVSRLSNKFSLVKKELLRILLDLIKGKLPFYCLPFDIM
mmetsp:Transcript_30019/g.48021  ORF Transcript_30019/g.48021 Transcript_30019/m.48021 type:complete len:247 (-) Transcript_30019:1497-2237(-)